MPMEGKIIAIIIAAVVVAGGAGTATAIILMNNDDGGDNYGVDTVRTDLKVGDYMKFKIDTHMTHEGSAAGCSREAMLNDIYYVDTIPAQAIHHNVTYKGSTVVCNEYVYNDGDMIVYASEDTEFIYQITITHKDGRQTYTLSDTNLDLSKDYGSQTISSGSFVLYDYEMVVAHSTGTCTGTYKLWMEDFNGSNGTYWDSDDRTVDLEITYEITSVNSETNMIKIKGDDDEHPASWYLR